MEQEALARLKAKALAEGRTLVCVDESGFYLLPALLKTYAPVGETPCLSVPLTRDHLSVIGAVSASGKLWMQVKHKALNSLDVIAFLRHLLRHIPGKLLLLWDGSPIHRSRQVKAFLQTEGAYRLCIERLPAYAPDLNPEEGVWRHLKRVELKNVCCQDTLDLKQHLRRAKERLRHKRHILQACFLHAGVV